jgi:hypothetical protein
MSNRLGQVPLPGLVVSCPIGYVRRGALCVAGPTMRAMAPMGPVPVAIAPVGGMPLARGYQWTPTIFRRMF